MTVHKTFYTETMARILADQEKFQDAAKIYRHLLADEPGNTQWASALAAMERAHAKQQAVENEEPLAALFQCWVDIASRYNKVRKVKKLKP